MKKAKHIDIGDVCVTATHFPEGGGPDGSWEIKIELGMYGTGCYSRYMSSADARKLGSALIDAANHYDDVRRQPDDMPDTLNVDTPAQIAPERAA